MIYINKKGLSPIIATVLLILLTVSAAVFISKFIYDFVKEKMDKTDCYDYTDYFKFDSEFGYNCYVFNDLNYSYKLSLTAKNVRPEAEEKVKGFGLRFYKEGDSKVVKVDEGQLPGEIKMLSNSSASISIPKRGETRSYNYSDSNKYASAKVYAILKSRECEAVEEASILAC